MTADGVDRDGLQGTAENTRGGGPDRREFGGRERTQKFAARRVLLHCLFGDGVDVAVGIDRDRGGPFGGDVVARAQGGERLGLAFGAQLLDPPRQAVALRGSCVGPGMGNVNRAAGDRAGRRIEERIFGVVDREPHLSSGSPVVHFVVLPARERLPGRRGGFNELTAKALAEGRVEAAGGVFDREPNASALEEPFE